MKKALGAILASSLVLTAAALPAAAQESRSQMRDRQDMTSQDMREQRSQTRKPAQTRDSAAQRADRKVVSAAERQLRASGHQVGRIDGRIDAATLNATANFQLERGLPPTGLLDLQTLAALGIDLEPTGQIGQAPQQ